MYKRVLNVVYLSYVVRYSITKLCNYTLFKNILFSVASQKCPLVSCSHHFPSQNLAQKNQWVTSPWGRSFASDFVSHGFQTQLRWCLNRELSLKGSRDRKVWIQLSRRSTEPGCRNQATNEQRELG